MHLPPISSITCESSPVAVMLEIITIDLLFIVITDQSLHPGPILLAAHICRVKNGNFCLATINAAVQPVSVD